jgi:hypothetical protein
MAISYAIQAIRNTKPGNNADALLARALGQGVFYLPPGPRSTVLITRDGVKIRETGHYLATGLTASGMQVIDYIPCYSTQLNTLLDAAELVLYRAARRNALLLLQLQQQFNGVQPVWLAVAKRAYKSDVSLVATYCDPTPVTAAFRCLLQAVVLYNEWCRTCGIKPLTELP